MTDSKPAETSHPGKRRGKEKDPWRPAFGRFGVWRRDHLRVAVESFRYVSERLGTSLLVWLLVGIALALPAGLYLAERNLSELGAAWEGRPGFTLYFEVGADTALVDEVATRLRNQDGVTEVRIVSAEEALAEFSQFAEIEDAVEQLAQNPLPASATVVMAAGTPIADLALVAEPLSGQPGVSDVVVETTWLERLAAISEVVGRLGVGLGALFAVGAVLVTASSVRLAMESQLDQLRVLKLVGATEGQIRRPFLYYGALYGLGGAVVAMTLISLLLVTIEGPLLRLVGSYGSALNFAGFDPMFLVALIGIGAVLGIAGAVIAARQRLSDLEIL